MTRLSSRSALCVDIALAHKSTNTQIRICARQCICVPPYIHTHSHAACMYTQMLHIHTCLLGSSFLILISSSIHNRCTLPSTPTLPVLPCLPHRGDFTQSEIQRCQHMSLAINLCHRALSWLPLLNTLPQRAACRPAWLYPHHVYRQNYSEKKHLHYSEWLCALFTSVLTNDNKQPASALVRRVTEAAISVWCAAFHLWLQ